MKRDAWYRFTFEDGAYAIALGLDANQARDLMERHGKFTKKEFVCWVGEMTTAQLLDMLTGGKLNAAKSN